MHKRHFAKSLLFFNFIAALHVTIGAYIHSSFLEQYLPLSVVSTLYTVAALLALIMLIQSERILTRFGGFIPTLALISVNSLSLFGLIFSRFSNVYVTPWIPAVLFIVHYAIGVFVLRFAFDIFYERQTSDDGVGIVRGELLTTQNIAWIVSPLIFSQLIGETAQYWKVYVVSFVLSLLLLVLAWMILPHGKEPAFKKLYFIDTLRELKKQKDLMKIFLVYFLLSFFFAWMVIYLPIYLHEGVGFTWAQIGILLTIMFIPYLLVDIPLGVLADKYFGEKEILFIGFLVLIISTFSVGLVTEKIFALWAIVLFMTRAGAGTIEVMTETYFFKKVRAADGHLISFFRNAQPIAYVVGPLLGSLFIFLGVTPGYLFMILAAFMILGALFATQINDTL